MNTKYAELTRLAFARDFKKSLPQHGEFIKKQIASGTFLYYTTSLGGVHKEYYIGKDSSELMSICDIMESYDIVCLTHECNSLAKSLQDHGYPSYKRIVCDILETLSLHGFF
ncbi:MAG: hypothetical protein LBR22_10485 [Desulfovibrio sp.]|jgi:hypothetical protein|nr:hypothetical protein [Desulfovibrio sp.]